MIDAPSTYEAMRHFADSWGLLVMVLLFLCFAVWPFRPSARAANEHCANMIFDDELNGDDVND
ncbi:MAG: cbb3-type cytochrome c oxidase subunit 3 [Sphingopyxis sp.]